MVRGTLEQNSLSLTLCKFAKQTTDPQEAPPKLMVPSYVEWKIIFEFRSAGRQLIQQHSALVALQEASLHLAPRWAEIPAGIYLLKVTSLFNANIYPY